MWQALKVNPGAPCFGWGPGAGRQPEDRTKGMVQEMKSIKIAMICLVSMFAMGMVVSVTASAAPPVWEGCLEGSTTTKYTTASCVTLGIAGSFGWKEINNTDKAVGKGFTVTLRDTEAPGGASEIRCAGENEEGGVVGPGNKGLITKVEIKNAKANCVRLTGACESGKVEKAVAADLPWQTTLFETEKKVLANVEADGSGEPGWAITCKVAGLNVTDTCTSVNGRYEQAKLSNVLSGGVLLVLGVSQKVSRQECTLSKKESGEIEGNFSITLASGSGLRVS